MALQGSLQFLLDELYLFLGGKKTQTTLQELYSLL